MEDAEIITPESGYFYIVVTCTYNNQRAYTGNEEEYVYSVINKGFNAVAEAEDFIREFKHIYEDSKIIRVKKR